MQLGVTSDNKLKCRAACITSASYVTAETLYLSANIIE
ncbi:hypothetical protein APHWI1_1415 [Anaplasma phagocytophilum str. ApWI1]|uniref:Uncharacterized protein n=1 Tax=Anaplasma phagocytophilum str. ApWI1 TaxID=1359155 RepID=A0A0F3PZT8_ANAPH|nr:hypothetical protein APHWEB_0106 [Anaplasma phagocytophilum str. Webster]KJV83511.1 hypothetical protein APHHGE2_0637 [Anaplasma phagocytophilum str. HGE2]KJV84694.1 hypothetical protein APHWI1_1415 [Anaplasma phagocytophilum str. ApWI1]KJV87970.1 hypothetical protein APHNYW_0367 [Anaplasma phagocytophilum str. ApNYW]